MGSLVYLASNNKKLVPWTREVARRKSIKGEAHGFPRPGKSTTSRRLTIAEPIKIAPGRSIRLSFEEVTSLLGACGSLCSVDEFCNPRATRIIASVTRGTWLRKDLQIASVNARGIKDKSFSLPSPSNRIG